jgi:predicted permease
MQEILKLLYSASQAVGTILLAAMGGALIVRFKLVAKDSLNILSKLVLYVMLPCLLFTKVSASINFERLISMWILPVSCVIYIFLGLFIGRIVAKICRPKPEMVPGITTAVAFSNASYLPIPLLVAVVYIFPLFSNSLGGSQQAAAEIVTLISVFLICFSPLMWTIGFSLISGDGIKDITIKKLLPPPVIGILIGLLVGLIPPLKSQLCAPDGLFHAVFRAASIMAEGTIPCALLILGGKLSHGPPKGAVNRRTIFAVILTKLMIFPALAMGYVAVLLKFNLIPASMLFILVLIIEAGSPPANNLVVMASLANRKIEDGMAAILFWSYLVSIPTLTFLVMLTIYLFKGYIG